MFFITVCMQPTRMIHVNYKPYSDIRKTTTPDTEEFTKCIIEERDQLKLDINTTYPRVCLRAVM